MHRHDVRSGRAAAVIGVTEFTRLNLFVAVTPGILLIAIGILVRTLAHHNTSCFNLKQAVSGVYAQVLVQWSGTPGVDSDGAKNPMHSPRVASL